MPNILTPLNITVNTGGTITLPTTTSHNIFIFNGTSTLASGYNIIPDSGAVEGMIFKIKWQAAITQIGANVVTIFGTTLTNAQALSELYIECYYNGSTWDVDIMIDTESIPDTYTGVDITTVPSGGGTVILIPGTNKSTQQYTGTVTLSSSYTITAGGSPSNGDSFRIIWNSVCTKGVNNVTIFGISLDSIQALSGNIVVDAVYNGSIWVGQLIEGELKINSVTNPMLSQMPTLTVKGNLTGTTANASDITISALSTELGIPGALAQAPYYKFTNGSISLTGSSGSTSLLQWDIFNSGSIDPQIFKDYAYIVRYTVLLSGTAANIASAIDSVRLEDTAAIPAWSAWTDGTTPQTDFPESANSNVMITKEFLYAVNTSITDFRLSIYHSSTANVTVKRASIVLSPIGFIQ